MEDILKIIEERLESSGIGGTNVKLICEHIYFTTKDGSKMRSESPIFNIYNPRGTLNWVSDENNPYYNN